jgi:GNAT superfamily N-acetyltransferase
MTAPAIPRRGSSHLRKTPDQLLCLSMSTEVRISVERRLDQVEALDLYKSVEWNAYTNDPEKLVRGIAGSHLLLTARDDRGRLLGLARTISDGETTCYVQDLLVRPEAHRTGIGRRLMEELIQRYEHCRLFVLLTDSAGTDAATKSHPFYRSLGLMPDEEQGMAAFVLRVKQ